MKMLSLDLEDILDDNMDKAGEANVSAIVGDFKIMDKADVAEVSTIVGVKDVTSKLKLWHRPILLYRTNPTFGASG
jgi:hypothetical protein